MGAIKTKVTNASVEDFINSVGNEKRRKDGFKLLEIFKKVTGLEAKMWGPSLVGFGQYHYKSERSSQEGDWPLAAFSPRKQNLTLYVMTELSKDDDLFKKLGKFKTSVGCLYINKLEDVDLKILEKIVAKSFKQAKETLGTN